MKSIVRGALAGIPALLIAGAADAHTGLGQPAGFASGLVHPFLGLDHLVAMLAAGVYAGKYCGGSSWRMLSVVVAAVCGGLLLGGAGLPGAAIETGIVGSVLLLGLLLLCGLRFGTGWMMAGAMLFGAVHGHAHGAEMAAVSGAWAYCSGLLAGTGLVLGMGAVLGVLSRIDARLGDAGIRAIGGAVCTVALFLLLV